MRANTINGNRIFGLLAALLLVGVLLAGLTTSASAGNGGPSASAAKKKKCKKGFHRVKVHGKKKCKKIPTPAPVVTPAPAPTTTLAINPTSFDFGSAQHGGPPCPACPSHAFTVTNTGAAASGVPTTSITVVHDPEIPPGPAAFIVTANTCTFSLAPGGSCSLTVKFAPNSNAGDQMYSSVLHVTATPGSDAQSALSGFAV